MSLTIAATPTTQKLSQQMCAVLVLLSADQFLMKSVEAFINLNSETIEWDEIFKISFGSGHSAAISWAYAICGRFRRTEPGNFMNRSHPVSPIGATQFHQTDPLVVDLR
jgi:hypothetical protein